MKQLLTFLAALAISIASFSQTKQTIKKKDSAVFSADPHHLYLEASDTLWNAIIFGVQTSNRLTGAQSTDIIEFIKTHLGPIRQESAIKHDSTEAKH